MPYYSNGEDKITEENSSEQGAPEENSSDATQTLALALDLALALGLPAAFALPLAFGFAK